MGAKGATVCTDKEAQDNGSLRTMQPAQHPTRGKRKDWKPEQTPIDPIGYLLADLVCFGVIMNNELQILIQDEPPIDIICTPYQYLYTTVLQAATRARTRAAEGTTTRNCDLTDIDKAATNISHKQIGKNDVMYLQTHQAGGGWDLKQLQTIGAIDDSQCKHCGEEHRKSDLLWKCQHPDIT